MKTLVIHAEDSSTDFLCPIYQTIEDKTVLRKGVSKNEISEQIKIHVGAALKDLDNPPDDMPVNGRDLVTGIPKQIMVNGMKILRWILSKSS